MPRRRAAQNSLRVGFLGAMQRVIPSHASLEPKRRALRPLSCNHNALSVSAPHLGLFSVLCSTFLCVRSHFDLLIWAMLAASGASSTKVGGTHGF